MKNKKPLLKLDILGLSNKEKKVLSCLLLDLHVLPEGHVVTKVFFNGVDGAGQWFWVAPGVVFAGFIALCNIKVLANTLPWAGIRSWAFF